MVRGKKTFHIECAVVHPTELQYYAAHYWATLHPTELRCTLLSFAASYWATFHPNWATHQPDGDALHPTELRCTLLSYASP